MAYTVLNFKTKKDLRQVVANYHEFIDSDKPHNAIKCYQPGLGSDLSNFTGKVSLEGPHEWITWYAQAELRDGVVVKVS